MRAFARVRSFASAVFRRSRIESDMDEELRAHIEDRANDLKHSGLSRAEAERRARLEFGGYQKFKEECRDARGVPFPRNSRARRPVRLARLCTKSCIRGGCNRHAGPRNWRLDRDFQRD